MIDIILKFMFFAIVGYIAEVTYVYILDRKWINRGFLHGPYLPIYAFGSIFTIIFLNKYYEDPLIVFFMGMIICSLLEYYTSHVMEKIFNRRWWDYSHHKYNINGRVSLTNTLLFGIGCIIIIYFLSPLITNWINSLNSVLKIVITIIFSLVILTDLVISSIEAYKTSKNINKLTKKIMKNQKEITDKIKTRILRAYPFLVKNNEELIEFIEKIKKDLNKKIKKLKK